MPRIRAFLCGLFFSRHPDGVLLEGEVEVGGQKFHLASCILLGTFTVVRELCFGGFAAILGVSGGKF